jgi:hypothetical protein
MILAEEISPPFFSKPSIEVVFARVDIDKDSDFLSLNSLGQKDIWPVLFKNSIDFHPSHRHQPFIDELVEQYSKRALTLKTIGYNRLVIAADGDSILQRILSPRLSSLDLEARKNPLLTLFQAMNGIIDDVVVLLTVEELAPGGLDATDGITIANDLKNLGLKTIIATSGTKDFLPLYERRTTQKKSTHTTDFLSHEPDLASALWLLDNTSLSVWCSAFIDNEQEAVSIAQSLGIACLIRKFL